MIRIISIILAGAVVSGCAYLQDVYSSDGVYGSGADPYEKIQFAGEKATGAERAACESAGGRVARDGMRGWEQCIQPFEDAGKACADNADCIGQCRSFFICRNCGLIGLCGITQKTFFDQGKWFQCRWQRG